VGFASALRNGLAIGLGSIATLFSGYRPDQPQGNLGTENGDNLVQENGSLILV
jgi:hypothetical protein